MRESRDASLILTVLNEATTIGDFFETLSRQTVLPREVVIVDGGSTDGTIEMIRSWEAPPECSVVILEHPGANISRGRNVAIASASYDRLLVTDAGTRLTPQWAETLLAELEDADVDVVSGFFRPKGDTPLERAIAFVTVPRREEIRDDAFLTSSRSLAVRRRAWSEAGGYPEWLDYCEDLVLNLRMRRQGRRFVFAPDAWVSWSARPTLASFMRQYFRYARGDGKADLWRRRHAARYAAYAAGSALAGGALVRPRLLLPLIGGFSVYMAKYWQRLWTRRSELGSRLLLSLVLAPVIVVSGDVAKMAGYPVGVKWRVTHASPGEDVL